MPHAEPRSLQQIKRETEQTRAGLTDTVEELRTSVTETVSDIRERIRPEAIKAEVSDYIKGRGDQLLNDVTAAARRSFLFLDGTLAWKLGIALNPIQRGAF